MKAMILAAGRGERMRPLTDHLPKPLLRVGDKSLIEHHIIQLVRQGITDIVINHAWLGSLIEEALGDGARYGCHLSYSAEGAAGLETAGGIVQALSLLGDEPNWVVNGEVWTDFQPKVPLTLAPNQLAHLILVPNPEQHPLGDFGLEQGKVLPQAPVQWTFSGIGCYSPELFRGLAPGVRKLAPILRQAMEHQQVTGELYQGRWFDIGTPARLELANTLWQQEQSDVG